MMGNDHDGQVWGMGNDMGWGGWLMMTIVLIAVLALVGGLLYALVRGSMTSTDRGTSKYLPDAGRSAAELTLDGRFARGEIDQPEYEQRKRALDAR